MCVLHGHFTISAHQPLENRVDQCRGLSVTFQFNGGSTMETWFCLPWLTMNHAAVWVNGEAATTLHGFQLFIVCLVSPPNLDFKLKTLLQGICTYTWLTKPIIYKNKLENENKRQGMGTSNRYINHSITMYIKMLKRRRLLGFRRVSCLMIAQQVF